MPAIHRNPSRPCALNRCALGKRGRARGTIPNKYRVTGISAAPQEDIMTPLTRAEIGRDAMAARRQKQRLGTRARDALELLAAASPSCPEPLLLAHGIKIEMIAGLVRKGLATAQTEAANVGGRPVEIVRVGITDAGRKAIED